jgi:hypothetical protein
MTNLAFAGFFAAAGFVTGFFVAAVGDVVVFGRFAAGPGAGVRDCLFTPFVFGASAVSSAFRLPLNVVVCTPFVRLGVVAFVVFFAVGDVAFAALAFVSALTFGSAAFLVAAAAVFFGGIALLVLCVWEGGKRSGS